MTSASQKKLTWSKKQRAGRSTSGRIAVRHRGGGHKRRVRDLDFKRDKTDKSSVYVIILLIDMHLKNSI